MCFAYFKMKRFEKNPKKYIKEKIFFFPRGYKLKGFHRNAEYCFNFYLEGKDLDHNHSYLFYENEDCIFSNTNTTEKNNKSLDIQFTKSYRYFYDNSNKKIANQITKMLV